MSMTQGDIVAPEDGIDNVEALDDVISDCQDIEVIDVDALGLESQLESGPISLEVIELD